MTAIWLLCAATCSFANRLQRNVLCSIFGSLYADGRKVTTGAYSFFWYNGPQNPNLIIKAPILSDLDARLVVHLMLTVIARAIPFAPSK